MDQASRPPTVDRALVVLKARLSATLGVRLRELRLFGSYARGDAGSESDVDVLVLVDRLRDSIERLDLVEMVAGVGMDNDLLIEGVVMGEDELAFLRTCETAFAKALDTEGVVL
jgi:predicted nucleotidyltransferase